VNAHGTGSGHLSEQVVSGQEDTVFMAGCRHEDEPGQDFGAPTPG
jgi:hypothetical protein